jgi:hypothetical protein
MEVTFSLDVKWGEIHHMHAKKSQRHDSRGSDGHMGRMSTMTSVFHQSVIINIKGGYCSLIGLVVIDVNP